MSHFYGTTRKFFDSVTDFHVALDFNTSNMVNMLVKFEAKSNRVKGLTFHPTMPWLLSALHNGTIQLWDYQLGVLLDKFEEHEGPVRGMSFHHNQPLFVSGGDDYKVKVWNYKLKRCLFTLLGHLDYIRTTVFHHEYPWILSASDDQTIRIWNWQSRQCIAVLTGHNHYVMCANFHPKDDLVVSASLDQTIRVWDVSGLKEKTVSSTNRGQSSSGASADLFGVNDAVVKFVLEGHDRGVNWVDFHHSQPMIVSASDDRSIKLWRYNESKAWEIDCMRGHTNNVSAVMFHSKQDLIISDGEDKTIRVWDGARRQLLHTFRRESDRFWVLACHKNSNMIAAGHDSGMVIFKLDRERPLCGAPLASSTISNYVFVVKNRMLTAVNSQDVSQVSVIGNCRKQASPMSSGFKALAVNPYNSTELNVLVTYDSPGEGYDLFNGPNQVVLRPSAGADQPAVQAKEGSGGSAVAFIARNRFAVLAKDGANLNIYSTHNELVKKIELPFVAQGLFPGGSTNKVILSVEDKAVLFDTASKEILGELILGSPVRQAVWSQSNTHVAFVQKHGVVIADHELKFIQGVAETIRVKSGVWDENSVFVYSTSSHIKYVLPFSEERGMIQAVSAPVYLVRVGGGSMTYVDRECVVSKSKLFTHEYLFKQALVQGKSKEVLQHLKNGRLLGSVTIGYLKKKGFPEVALHFVEDLETRFNLSLEFGHIAEALEAAKQLRKREVWERLHREALRLGNVDVAEKAAIANHDIPALQFLYLLTGNATKMTKLSHKLGKDKADPMARFNLALLRGEASERASILEELGLPHLAAKTRQSGAALIPSLPVDPNLSASNWPMTTSLEAMFEAQWAGLEAAALAAAAKLPPASPEEEETLVPEKTAQELAPVVDSKAWGDDELDAELEHVQLPTTVVAPGHAAQANQSDVIAYGEARETQWLAKRRTSVDLIVAGEYVEALSLLQRRIALVNPGPLKPLFEDLVMASHACVPGLPFTPSITVPIGNTEPGVLFSVAFLKAKMGEALHHTGFGNAGEALAAARYVIHALTLSLARSSQEEQELVELLGSAQKYAHAMLIETTRRTEQSGTARDLELAAYLCCEKLEPIHMLLVTDLAMKMAFKSKCFIQASHFAKRIITGSWGAGDEFVTASTTRARKVIIASEERGTDEIKINFDPNWMTGDALKLCSGSLTPVPAQLHDKMVSCPLCKSGFHPDWQGKVCTVCQLSQVGASVLGLQFLPAV